MSQPPELVPDEPLCGYQLQEKLGAGSFGSVYLITEHDGKKMALKNITDEVFPIEIAISTRWMHPNLLNTEHILTSLDCDIKGIGLISPLATTSLDKAALQPSYLLGTKIATFFQILQGLSFLHDNGALHLDIKDVNILLFGSVFGPHATCTAKLGDFGLSLPVNNAGHGRGLDCIQGTPSTTAPEILKGTLVYSASTDIWSLGVTFLELFSGKSVSNAKNSKELSALLPQLFSDSRRRSTISGLLSSIPTEAHEMLVDVFNGMLQLNPMARLPASVLSQYPIFANCSSSGPGMMVDYFTPQILDQAFSLNINILGELIEYIKVVDDAHIGILFLSLELLFKSAPIFLLQRVKCCFDTARAIIASRPMSGDSFLRVVNYTKGLIYQNTLYQQCTSLEQLQYLFSRLVLEPSSYVDMLRSGPTLYSGFTRPKDSLTTKQFLSSLGLL